MPETGQPEKMTQSEKMTNIEESYDLLTPGVSTLTNLLTFCKHVDVFNLQAGQSKTTINRWMRISGR